MLKERELIRFLSPLLNSTGISDEATHFFSPESRSPFILRCMAEPISLAANHFKAKYKKEWSKFGILVDRGELEKNLTDFCQFVSDKSEGFNTPFYRSYSKFYRFLFSTQDLKGLCEDVDEFNLALQKGFPGTGAAPKLCVNDEPDYSVVDVLNEILNEILGNTMAEGGGQHITDFFHKNEISVEGGVKLFPSIHSVFRTTQNGCTFITDIIINNSEESKIVELNEPSSFTQIPALSRKYIEFLEKVSFFSACGLNIEKCMTLVEGHVLKAPVIEVGGDNKIRIPADGQWTYDGGKLFMCKKITGWAVINFCSGFKTSGFCEKFIKHAQAKGMTVEEPALIFDEDAKNKRLPAHERVEQVFKKLNEKKPCISPANEKKSVFESIQRGLAYKFLLCVMDKKTSDIYGALMRKCHVEAGIITHCISPNPTNEQYLTNVVLKINAKLGGCNFVLAKEALVSRLNDRRTMILGVSICHGSPSESDIPSIRYIAVPSIVAGVCSVYGSKSEHRVSVRAQSLDEEMVTSLFKPTNNGGDAGIFRELLAYFRMFSISKTTQPERIIFFRSGVSESQFDLLESELVQIKKAIEHVQYEMPKFTVITVETSSHTKLFTRNGDSRKEVPAGTVVDSDIVGSTARYEFYICSHKGITGTSCPTRYTVLQDENSLTREELQQLVHSLSYSCQTSTTMITEVAPIRYAQRAAAHIRKISMAKDTRLYDSKVLSSGFMNLIPRAVQDVNLVTFSTPPLPRLRGEVQETMFFC